MEEGPTSENASEDAEAVEPAASESPSLEGDGLDAGSSAGPDDGLFVFGAAKVFGAEELEALRLGLLAIGPNLSESWPGVLLREVEIKLVEVTTGPRPVLDLDDAPAAADDAGDDSGEPSADASATESTGPAWLDGLGGDGPFASVAELSNGLGGAALVIPGELALLLVDVLLGGSGRSTGARAISAIDVDLLSALVAPTFDALHASLVDAPTGRRFRVPDELDEADVAALLGVSMTATFDVAIDETVLQLYLVLSGATVTAVLGSGAGDPAAELEIGDAQRVIQAVLADVVLEAVVNFPSVTVPSRTVLGIDIGDVIGLGVSTDSVLNFKVDELDFGTVRPARSGAALACQVVTTANRTGGSTPGPAKPGPSNAAGPTNSAVSVSGGVL